MNRTDTRSLSVLCFCIALSASVLCAQSMMQDSSPGVASGSGQAWLGGASEQDMGAVQGGFLYTYAVKEKNHGEAALYALVGVPAMVPLGQLYNGELGKAGMFMAARLVSAGVCVLATSAWLKSDRGGDGWRYNTEAGWLWASAVVYAGISIYSVVDAVVSVEAVNRRTRENGPPGIKVGLQRGL